MQPRSPSGVPLTSKSPIMETAAANNNNSQSLTITPLSSPSTTMTNSLPQRQQQQQQQQPQRNALPLKFSIAKIMEPDSKRSSVSSPKITVNVADDESSSTSDVEIISMSSSTTYDSAFKKYIPKSSATISTAAATAAAAAAAAMNGVGIQERVQHFVSSRHQELMNQYPLLYYPGQLMCAAAQYAALTQHTNAVSSLLGANSVQNTPFDLRSLSSSMNHFQTASSIGRQTIRNEKLPPSPVSPVASLSASRTVASPKNQHSPSSTGSASLPPNALNNKQKTFACPECGKVFNAHYNLTRHMPVHTGARPFICKICGKGFRQASTLW